MKKAFFLLVLCSAAMVTFAQKGGTAQHVIIVTTDGFRWQEVFGGMDSTLACDAAFNQKDSSSIFKKYWAATADERRRKLLPFLWNTIGAKGQLYGNRALGVKVNNANPFWFSYPGYSELFTGDVDTAINSNDYMPNPHSNLLEYLNKQPKYRGKVAAFGAWDAFGRILNEQRSGLPVVCGFGPCGGAHPDAEETLINNMKRDCYNPFGEAEAPDVFTHYAAIDYLQKKQPDVLYISYGETDEWAHAGHYRDYLDAAHAVDKWLNDIWSYIQANAIYKDNTLLFISVDHGRGNGSKWTSHNSKVPNSDEIWLAVMGPGIATRGEVKRPVQLYQKQYAATIAELLGLHFTCEHEVAKGFEDLLR